MSRHLTPVVAAASAAAYTTGVVRRMTREYESTDTLRPATVVALYSAYAATAGALAWAARRRSWPLPLPAATSRTAGVILAAGGTGIAGAGMGRFGSAAQLSGIRAGSLANDGIYRHTRNPQYLGLAGILGGTTLISRSGLAATTAAFAVAILDRWIRTEEQHLERVFGDSYSDYRAEVPRWL